MERGFDTCLALLTGGETPTVWSLIITIFGDMAQAKGQTLTTPTLTGLTGKLGIKPEATRVALHRLKSDGWLWSERAGRSSKFGLTNHGRAQSLEATPRIYARHSDASAWFICIADPAARDPLSRLVAQNAAHPVAPGVAVTTSDTAAEDKGLLFLPGGEACPEWVSHALCPQTAQAASASLLARLDKAEAALPHELDRAEAAALRVLIVHEWRRVILRVPDLPGHLLPPGWKGDACRVRVHHLLDRLT